MTPKEKKWTELMAWVNNNTCFTGKDVLEVIRALDDSRESECECVCPTCQLYDNGTCIMTKAPISTASVTSCTSWKKKESCMCSDYDETKTCLTCVHRVTVGHEPYCDDPDSGWHYHGKVLRCERWQGKDKKPLCKCSTCKFFKKADWCDKYNSELRGCDGCSEWKPTDKEPTDASYLLMTLLTKQITKLQDQVEFQRDKIRHLEKRLDDHITDKDIHLKQPERYKASNSLM